MKIKSRGFLFFKYIIYIVERGEMKVLFIGDIFGEPGLKATEKHLQKFKNSNKIDFVIVQGENVSGRKGLVPADYDRLKKAGVDVITMGNHVWAKKEIVDIIDNQDIIRPYNIDKGYKGKGTNVFTIKGKKIRVTSILGCEFNELRTGWDQNVANNFFDAFDKIYKKDNSDYHIIDFHGEVTSEKNVFSIYVDGKATAVLGTHTHVQTNDSRILPNGTAYITDVGSTGPINAAIGAEWESVYRKMRYNDFVKFKVSDNAVELNAVILHINKNDLKIETIRKAWR